VNIQTAVYWGTQQLQQAEQCSSIAGDSHIAKLEAVWMLAETLNCSTAQIRTWPDNELTVEQEQLYLSRITRRAAGEPFAYITGEREFFGLKFKVTSGVLIPRPETELLVEAVVSRFSKSIESYTVVDVGVGSGAIILSVMFQLRKLFGEDFIRKGRFIAIDISTVALECAKNNALRFGFDKEVEFSQRDLLAGGLELKDEALNIVTANLPYVPISEMLSGEVENFEPELALRGGEEGLDIIARFLTESKSLPAALFIEFGKDQATRLKSLLSSSGRNNFHIIKDLQSIDRIAVVER